jgi:lysophospholipase L1-like esterase
MKTGDCSGLLADGLHPNSKGHELIFSKVRDFLDSRSLI